MIRRATWFFAAASVVLLLMLAAVAYGWWHQRQDAERERVLDASKKAVAVAEAAREAGLEF